MKARSLASFDSWKGGLVIAGWHRKNGYPRCRRSARRGSSLDGGPSVGYVPRNKEKAPIATTRSRPLCRVEASFAEFARSAAMLTYKGWQLVKRSPCGGAVRLRPLIFMVFSATQGAVLGDATSGPD